MEAASPSPDQHTTTLSDGRKVGTDELVPIVYDNLRKLAASFLRREDAGQTLQPTALVHEAYIKLADQDQNGWANRAHFLAVAGGAMRRVLVDAARARKSLKRGGALQRVTLMGNEASPQPLKLDVLELETALEKLEQVNERQVRIVEMHFFSGLPLEEVGRLLGLSRATIVRQWALARAWLSVEMNIPPLNA